MRASVAAEETQESAAEEEREDEFYEVLLRTSRSATCNLVCLPHACMVASGLSIWGPAANHI